MNQIKVLLVDDQTLFVESLRTVLKARAEDVEVVGVAADGREAIELVAREGPDIVLMDIRMANMNGVESTRIIKEKYPLTRVLMLTTVDEDEYIVEALRLGAAGYLLKDISASELIAALRAVFEGGVMISPKMVAKLVENHFNPIQTRKFSPPWLSELSGRERQILSLMIQGLENKDIAKQLYLGEQTIRNYASLIYSKMGVSDRIQAIRIALEAGFDKDQPVI
ncbi:LuxR family two component transcriptional regulator [Hydrogenispora ethanolica]|uniref:LuxR family two component transcriptional regulator n=1 Tax=Hydrogenispora ethanolica TaxID=1082276 RepID=A0A4V2QGM7_HYDET|nr:response regulator transcription factor [Hydrogenispora ethanolica]TCL76477.1 LuxR family two component transcriptional regulator [Hydrogenispora ethanolica]